MVVDEEISESRPREEIDQERVRLGTLRVAVREDSRE